MARKPMDHDELARAYEKQWERAMGPEKSRNPLSSVLIATAFVEKALMALLSEQMTDASTAEGMFKSSGPLGDMFKCANMAYALGLICKSAHAAILVISDVRNLFAHAHEELDFSSPVIREKMKKLKPPLGGTAFSEVLSRGSPQGVFEWVAMRLYHEIGVTTDFVRAQKPLGEFKKAAAVWVSNQEIVWTDSSARRG